MQSGLVGLVCTGLARRWDVDDLEFLDDGEVVLHAMGEKTVTLEWPDDACGVELSHEEVYQLWEWLGGWLRAHGGTNA